ncbi:MAG: protein phosphatase CheZ [Deltaproteobacteria bacterium]|jgi:chemotaxis regulatin CheY-phosphate phosphatase CheZ|nr:protein phosphatase CheZ [Deltaproteobacteria bacterium]
MTTSPPVIGFELGVGEFRIVTPQAIYNIKVIPELVKANVDWGVLSPAARRSDDPAMASASCPTITANSSQATNAKLNSPSPTDPAFFQEISQELFERVGQLARQLSVSVTEIPDSSPSLTQTGADLEDAKGQLEEVVEITEKASMTIMDVAEQIQGDMETLNEQMSALTSLESLKEKLDPPDHEASELAFEAFKKGFAELKTVVDSLSSAVPLGSLEVTTLPPAPEAPIKQAPPPPPPITVIQFDLDGVFQTLYEFCANESVKTHIKGMRAASQAGGFNNQAILRALSDLAGTLEVDEGFYNVPIANLLKILYSNASSDEDKGTLKKMNQTAASIFLDANLPVEGQVQTLAPPAALVELAAPAPIESNPPESELTPNIGPDSAEEPELANLKAIIERLEGLWPKISLSGGAFVPIPKADRDAIISSVTTFDTLIKNTSHHLTKIMEALSFQDLSGQRIKKIVNLISDIQVQLLSLLVSVDSKIKAHKDSPTQSRPKEETDKVAQAEVDRMLEKLTAEPSVMKGPGADNRLDQSAVNDLLAGLGF